MRHIRLASIAAAVSALSATMAHATNYYVDASVATSGNGLSAATAFKTIADINNLNTPATQTKPTLKKDDRVLFKCGQSWPGPGEVPTTLQLKSEVVYSSYSTDNSFNCSNPRPVLRGSIVLSGLNWNKVGNNLFWADLGANADIWRALSGVNNIAQLIDPSANTPSKRLPRARHPNTGSGTYPVTMSQYLPAGTGSNDQSLVLDPNSPLPSTAPAPNLTDAQVFVRRYNWLVSRFNVLGQTGSTVQLSTDDLVHQDAQSIDPVRVGGYWLENQQWMVDSDGEWFYDYAHHKLFVWRDSGTAPGTLYASINNYAVTAGLNANEEVDLHSFANGFTFKNINVQDTALDGVAIMGNPRDFNPAAEGTSTEPQWTVNKFSLEDMAVTRAGRYGVAIRSVNGRPAGTEANNIFLKNLAVSYSLDVGIDLGGRREFASSDFTEDGRVDGWMPSARGVYVWNSTLTDIGTERFALSALRLGAYSNATQNTINNPASRGIHIDGKHSTVANNVISGACARVDDCGAIYVNGRDVPDAAPSITGNIVKSTGSSASADGRGKDAMGNTGIYLDDYTADAIVKGNAVFDTDIGIFLHGTLRAKVENNGVDASRQVALLIGPSTPNGNFPWDTAGNDIKNNTLLARANTTSPVVRINTGTAPNPAAVASFMGNIYAARNATPFWEESDSRATLKLNMGEWQTIGGRDPGGNNIYIDSLFYSANASSNLIYDGSFAGFNAGEHSWASDAGGSVHALASQYLNASNECNQTGFTFGNCLKLNNPNQGSVAFHTEDHQFPIEAGKDYLLVFDAKSPQHPDNLFARIHVLGAPSETPPGPSVTVGIGTGWKTYSVPLKAAVTNPLGRLDLSLAGDATIYLSNVRLLKVASISANAEKAPFFMLMNDQTVAVNTLPCLATLQNTCANGYMEFGTGSGIGVNTVAVNLGSGNSNSLPAKGFRSFYRFPNYYLDSDGDGVPNQADTTCPSTTPGTGSDEKGCGIPR